jgi:hypothetical protein
MTNGKSAEIETKRGHFSIIIPPDASRRRQAGGPKSEAHSAESSGRIMLAECAVAVPAYGPVL